MAAFCIFYTMNISYLEKQQSLVELMQRDDVNLDSVRKLGAPGTVLVEFKHQGRSKRIIYDYSRKVFDGVPPALERCFNGVADYLKDAPGVEQVVEYLSDLATKPEASEPLMTLSEVAEMLRISNSTVYKLIHNQGLPAIKLGNKFRFIRNKINEWLDQRQYHPD